MVSQVEAPHIFPPLVLVRVSIIIGGMMRNLDLRPYRGCTGSPGWDIYMYQKVHCVSQQSLKHGRDSSRQIVNQAELDRNIGP